MCLVQLGKHKQKLNKIFFAKLDRNNLNKKFIALFLGFKAENINLVKKYVYMLMSQIGKNKYYINVFGR